MIFLFFRLDFGGPHITSHLAGKPHGPDLRCLSASSCGFEAHDRCSGLLADPGWAVVDGAAAACSGFDTPAPSAPPGPPAPPPSSQKLTRDTLW